MAWKEPRKPRQQTPDACASHSAFQRPHTLYTQPPRCRPPGQGGRLALSVACNAQQQQRRLFPAPKANHNLWPPASKLPYVQAAAATAAAAGRPVIVGGEHLQMASFGVVVPGRPVVIDWRYVVTCKPAPPPSLPPSPPSPGPTPYMSHATALYW